MLSISDLIEMMIDPGFFNIEIYDLELGATVYVGPADEVPEDYVYSNIQSLDSPINSTLCINI